MKVLYKIMGQFDVADNGLNVQFFELRADDDADARFGVDCLFLTMQRRYREHFAGNRTGELLAGALEDAKASKLTLPSEHMTVKLGAVLTGD